MGVFGQAPAQNRANLELEPTLQLGQASHDCVQLKLWYSQRWRTEPLLQCLTTLRVKNIFFSLFLIGISLVALPLFLVIKLGSSK